jgi:hypothetical protein
VIRRERKGQALETLEDSLWTGNKSKRTSITLKRNTKEKAWSGFIQAHVSPWAKEEI